MGDGRTSAETATEATTKSGCTESRSLSKSAVGVALLHEHTIHSESRGRHPASPVGLRGNACRAIIERPCPNLVLLAPLHSVGLGCRCLGTHEATDDHGDVVGGAAVLDGMLHKVRCRLRQIIRAEARCTSTS